MHKTVKKKHKIHKQKTYKTYTTINQHLQTNISQFNMPNFQIRNGIIQKNELQYKLYI